MLYRNQRKPIAENSISYENKNKNNNSPTKGSVLVQTQCLDYIESLEGRKQNLKTSLQLYKISYENELPQKCFPHNNFITLYCQNQQKLLCVNCIYGSAAHKNHRVVPSKNSIKNIARDNEENINLLQQQLQIIKQSESELHKNNKILNEEYKRVLTTIDRQFQEMHKIITLKHNQMKQRAMMVFSRADENNLVGKEEIIWWKDYLGGLRVSLPKASQNQQIQVYKHLVLECLKKQKLDSEKLTYIASPEQITQEFVSQATELREIIQAKISGNRMVKSNRAEKIKLF